MESAIAVAVIGVVLAIAFDPSRLAGGEANEISVVEHGDSEWRFLVRVPFAPGIAIVLASAAVLVVVSAAVDAARFWATIALLFASVVLFIGAVVRVAQEEECATLQARRRVVLRAVEGGFELDTDGRVTRLGAIPKLYLESASGELDLTLPGELYVLPIEVESRAVVLDAGTQKVRLARFADGESARDLVAELAAWMEERPVVSARAPFREPARRDPYARTEARRVAVARLGAAAQATIVVTALVVVGVDVVMLVLAARGGAFVGIALGMLGPVTLVHAWLRWIPAKNPNPR